MGNISQLLDSNSKHGEILSMAGKLAFDEKISAYVVGGLKRPNVKTTVSACSINKSENLRI
tara:strand:- start:657 stop:839 length:183 start_codon:yes stop_codon:yes gene_type:complete